MPMPRKVPRLTKCSICGQPALAGGRLCAPCRSALKRARDTTVSDDVPKSRHLRKLPAVREFMPAEPPEAPARSGPRLSWAIGAAILAAVGIVVFVQSRSDVDASASKVASAPVVTAETPVALEPGEAPITKAPASAAFTPADLPAAPAAREPINPRTMPSSIAVPRPVAKEAPPPPEPEPVVVAPPPSPPPAPAPIVVAQAPPPRAVPDRWQRLADQLAACPADLIPRAVCQEALRLEHCAGFWGRVAPCPARVEREYGN